MSKTQHYLNDEHMQMVEWSGAITGITSLTPAKSKRTHSWHASYSVLAVLTTLLILNGCDKKSPAERAGEQVDQAAREMKEKTGPLYDNATARPEPAQEAGQASEDMQKQ
jgi:hypothetical protein